MATPLSSSSSYCTVAEWLLSHDPRQIGDYVTSDDTRASEASLATHPVALEMLKRASGVIESACFVGERYSPDDLNALTGQSAAMLRGLCAELAFWYLRVRRNPQSEMSQATAEALETIERLKGGDRVFGLVENQEAGLPETDFVTQAQIDTLNLSTTIARRFFGERAKERRITP